MLVRQIVYRRGSCAQWPKDEERFGRCDGGRSEVRCRQRHATHSGELMKRIGDVRSELFHYEVRCTYNTPERAEHRRLIDEARRPDESVWEPTGWTPEDDEETEW